MNTYIDNYCERLEPGLWAEPLNAVTNISFLIAAFLCYRLAKREEALHIQSLVLIALMCAIGVGSTLFHTFATKLTLLSDVLPILLYQIAFIWFYALFVMRLHIYKVVCLFGAFLALTVLAENAPSHILNGSLAYAPSILFLFGLGIWHLKTQQKEKYVLLSASFIFMASLTFRSIDMSLCESFQIGTHFMWHILNGFVLYLATRSFILTFHKRSSGD